jgi:hypothetical protein
MNTAPQSKPGIPTHPCTFQCGHSRSLTDVLPRTSPTSLWKHPLSLISSIWDYVLDRDRNRADLQRSYEFQKQGIGYSEMHRTRPQTLGYSLSDSPVGLLSWIYDKLVNWTDVYPWTDDEGQSGTCQSQYLEIYVPGSSHLGLDLLVL